MITENADHARNNDHVINSHVLIIQLFEAVVINHYQVHRLAEKCYLVHTYFSEFSGMESNTEPLRTIF